jgi:hypothetical protein
MASSLPPVKGASFTFPVTLVSQLDTDIFQTTVTITVADVWVSKDGGAFAAAEAAPTELLTGGAAKTGVLWQGLTATEMDADIVTVLYHDADGSEWQDALVTIYTSAQTLDTIDTNIDTIDTNVDTVNANAASILADTGTDGVVIVNDGITAAKIAASAIGATEFAAAGLAAIADSVWDEATSGHTTAATFGAELDDIGAEAWGYATRTLTQSAAGVIATVAGSAITATRGDTLTATFSSLGSITGYTKLWFAAKKYEEDTDAESQIFIEAASGLVYLDGAATSASADGSISVTTASAGDLTVTVCASAMAGLDIFSGIYDLQYKSSASAITTLTSGKFTVVPDVSRATS